jgi:hypothetical protein
MAAATPDITQECSITRGKEKRMNTRMRTIYSLVIAVFLAGCAGQTEQLSMQQPTQGGIAVASDHLDQYLVNVPHRFYKVYGLGDIYSPKNVTLTQEQLYQNVRIMAVYQTDQVPVVPQAPRG